MADSKTPAGYGHDKKGAAGGETLGQGKPAVAHTAPVDKVDGKGEAPTAKTFFIDGREVDIRVGESIFRAARRLDIKLPHLCYTPKPGYRADGNCRVCMVEIEGERVLAASCIRQPAPGMKVKTQTDRAKTARKMVAELLVTDQQLGHHFARGLGAVGLRLDLHAGRRLADAACRQHALALDLDHADAAIAVGAITGLGRVA